MRRTVNVVIAVLVVGTLASCRAAQPASTGAGDPAAFVKEANDTLLRLGIEAQQAGWVAQTFITQDTEAMDARATGAYVRASTDLAKRAATGFSSIEVAFARRAILSSPVPFVSSGAMTKAIQYVSMSPNAGG